MITWSVKNDSEKDYTTAPERYLGSIDSNNTITAYLRLWNNRYGTKDEAVLKNFAIQASFSTLEDTSLLKYCSISYNNDKLSSQIIGNKVIFTVPSSIQLKGTANNGLTKENEDHYVDFVFTFAAPEDAQLKENDFKNLFLEVVHI